jgi:hypothetical protein
VRDIVEHGHDIGDADERRRGRLMVLVGHVPHSLGSIEPSSRDSRKAAGPGPESPGPHARRISLRTCRESRRWSPSHRHAAR